MTRVIPILFLITLVPIGVFAQAKGSRLGKDERAVTGSMQRDTAQAADDQGGLSQPAANDASSPLESTPMVAPQARTAPAPARGVSLRRRGSMVGYIEDAIVGSKIRVRFESGLHDHVPDRAEFFYAKCGCYRDLEGNPAFDPDAPGPGPGIVTDLNFRQLYFQGEYAVGNQVSLFAEMPVRWIQPQAFDPAGGGGFPNQAGIGDLRAGVKLAVSASADHSLTARLQAYLPTGSASEGLGTDHASLEPALLYYQKVSERLVLEAQIGDWHPLGGSAGVPTTIDKKFSGDVFFYGVGASYEVYRGDRARFAPVIELVGWRVLGGFQTASPSDASGINIVNLKIGGRITFDPRGSVYAGYGHKLTSDGWYDDIVRLEYRYSF